MGLLRSSDFKQLATKDNLGAKQSLLILVRVN